jgi:hypothetical protein
MLGMNGARRKSFRTLPEMGTSLFGNDTKSEKS